MHERLPIRDENIAFERHYTPKQLAELWLLHESTIQPLFLDEPGVLKYGGPCRRGRREYITLRIPESVARRVHEQRSH
jgi:hypothetical protein